MNLNLIQQTSPMRTFLKCAAVTTVMALSSAASFALPTDRNQPITLTADRATFNEKTGVTTYTGNVVIEQGTMKLQAANKHLKAAKGKEIKLGVYACPVNHPDHPQNLWLVVARNTGASEPWYLLTT